MPEYKIYGIRYLCFTLFQLKLTSNLILKTDKFIQYLESFFCSEATAPNNQYFFDVTKSFVIHALIFENWNKFIYHNDDLNLIILRDRPMFDPISDFIH